MSKLRSGVGGLALLACVVLSSALAGQNPGVLYYKFNEGTGNTTANLGSQGSPTATFSAAPTWETPGQLGAANVSFTGSYNLPTGYNANVTTGSWTIEFWIRVGPAGANANYVCGDVGHTSFRLFVHGAAGSGALLRGAGLADTPITGNLADDTWHHAAFVYDSVGQTTTSYLDGVQDSQVTGQVPAAVAGTGFVVGGYSTTFMTGRLDEFRFWNVARSASQIASNLGIEIGQSTTEINVVDPNGDSVSDGGSHRINPVAPSGNGSFSWTIQNLHPSVALNIGTITVTPVSGCTTNITANPSSTSILGGNSATLTIQVNGNAGAGTLQFTISIPNDDTNENPYDITVNGSRGLSGTLTVNNGGGGNYTDLGSFFDDLEAFGVAGPVTVEVSDNGTGYTSAAAYEVGSDTVGTTFTLQEVLGTSSTNTITVRAAAGQTPVITGAGASFELNGFSARCGLILTAVKEITIEGLSFDGGGIAGASDCGILIWQEENAIPGGAVSLLRNKIHDIGTGNGILAVYNNGTGLDNILIENNMIWDLGLTIGAFGGAAGDLFTGAISMWRPTGTCAVRHNSVLCTNKYFAGQTGTCYQNLGPGAALGELSYNVFSNLISNAPCVKINIGTTASPTAAPPVAGNRNVFHFPSGVMSDIYTSLANWRTGTGLDAQSVDQDPQYVSATGTIDLHIPAASPAVGLASGSTTALDIDGDTRPSGAAPDSGADENTGGGGGTVTVAATTTPASEPSTNGAWTITFSPMTTATTSVSFTLTGAATFGTDYSISSSVGTASGTGITGIPAGTTTVVVTLTVIDDGSPEGNEDAILTLTSATPGYTVGTPSAGTITINDDDATPTNPAISVSSSGSPSETGPTSGTFTISASPNPAAPIQVNVSFSGTAVNGTDYTVTGVTGGQVTVPVTGSVTVTITPVDDTASEGGESVILTINAGAGYTVGTQASATLTIADNDGTPPPPVTGGGGGGGGGGCAAMRDETSWMLVLFLLAMAAAATRMHARRE